GGVHPARETVEGVEGGTAFGRQDPGGRVVGTSVVGMQRATAQILLTQPARPDPGGVEFRAGGSHHRPRPSVRATTRAAASLPETRTLGSPSPGVVPQPARNAFVMPGTVLRGRNGPVWAKVWASEKGVPWTMPSRAQSAGVIMRSARTDRFSPVMPRSSKVVTRESL